MTCVGYPKAGEDTRWCEHHDQYHWSRGRGALTDAIEQFHDAMDNHDGCYHDRERGIVDGTSGEIVKALLAAGWRVPS
jgi:hypothetical protein